MPNEELKPLRESLIQYHADLPEGEFKERMTAILRDLNKAMGITKDEEVKEQPKKTK